ncbi:MAG: ACT domain-containing protein, partial [Candidatus Omnitrophica bacterium]|nr:ACT domain-containing protein [Candidatus Omnitrophota bacterium]
EGEMLVIQNLDVPGIIGSLGTLLGKHNINIAAMSFGRRDKPGGKAISLLNIDSPLSPEILKQIREIKDILGVKEVRV